MSIDERPSTLMAAAGLLLWFLMLSATLVETDAYRFAMLLVWGYGITVYARTLPRPATSLMAWYCMGWAVYVLVRFAYGYFSSGNHQHGSSEWLFAFPLFFGFLGIAMTRIRFHVEKLLLGFFAIAAILLAASQHWWIMASGTPVSPLFHNNQIHGAVACGMILIGAFYWFLHYAERGIRQSPYGLAAAALTPVIILLCLISIIGSQSKGAWLALLGSLPLAAVLLLVTERRAIIRLPVLGLILTVLGLGAVFHQRLWERAGDTVNASIDILGQLVSGHMSIATLLQQEIASGTVPPSLNERLKIWYNAAELIRQAPFFGHGNFWIEKWDHTRYADVGFYLMHNGYLEILIRHGIFGFLALAIMLFGLIGMIWRGYRRGFIPRAGLQAALMLIFFFGLTLLSNSNNRLAIGESLALLVGAVAFYAQSMERYQAASSRAVPSAIPPAVPPATPMES